MANLEISGIDELNDAFRRIGEIPESVTVKALSEMAAVAAAKIKAQGETMGVRDPESGEHILDRIKQQKPKMTDTGGYANITFTGSRMRGNTKTRNAEIAFVNEYGTRNMPARPFVGLAMTKNEAAIVRPGAAVIEDFIEKEFNR